MAKKIQYKKNNPPDDEQSLYWEDRIAKHVWNSYNTLEEENYALLDYYDRLSNNIRLKLYSLAEEEKSGDLTRTQRYLKNHLEQLQKQVIAECDKLGEAIERKATNNIVNEMQSTSQNVVNNTSSEFSMLPKKTCKEILNNPWHGSYFSKRLWKDTGKLANELNDILGVGITQGKTIAEMAIQLKNRIHQSMNDVHRLVRTETINALNNATLRSYKEASVKYVRWWAAEDERTCPICGANHGKVYPIDKVPNLPCHPNCRCTWLPVFEDVISKSGALSGGLNDFNDPLNKKREKVAIDLYKQICSRKKLYEIKAVAKNSGLSESDIEKIYNHVFIREHLFEDGSIHKFFPDYYMAHSWLRVREGKRIEKHDITLLYHELEEEKIMGDRLDIVYEKAHNEVVKTYNYQKELFDYLKESGNDA